MLGHCLEGEVDTRTLGDIVADEMNIRRKFSRFVILSGATDWDRTSNLRLRRPTLYPIELQSHLQSYRIISKKGLPRLVRSTTATDYKSPRRLGCAGLAETFAVDLPRRSLSNPPNHGMTSHPTGDRRDAIGRIHRPPDRPLRFKASGTPARRTCEAIRRVRVQFPWRAIAEGRPGPICAGSCCGSSASFAGEGGMCC